jgi:hypothetical protein
MRSPARQRSQLAQASNVVGCAEGLTRHAQVRERHRDVAPGKQSKTDQQIEFRNRWSSSTSSRIGSARQRTNPRSMYGNAV